MTKLITLSLLCITLNALGMNPNPDDQPKSKALLFYKKKQHQLQKIDDCLPNQICLQAALSKKIKKKYQPTLMTIPEDKPIKFPDRARFNPSHSPYKMSYTIKYKKKFKRQFRPNPRLPSAAIVIPLQKKIPSKFFS